MSWCVMLGSEVSSKRERRWLRNGRREARGERGKGGSTGNEARSRRVKLRESTKVGREGEGVFGKGGRKPKQEVAR